MGLSVRFIKANRGENALILGNGQDSQLSIYVHEVSDKMRRCYSFLGICMGNAVVYFSFFIAYPSNHSMCVCMYLGRDE